MLAVISTVHLAWGQAQQKSASDLIRYLTYQSDRPDKSGVLLGVVGCGHTEDEREDRQAAMALVKLGSSAIPAIELAFDSLGRQGQASEFSTNAGWLLHVYAAIRGPNAYPILRRMATVSQLRFLRSALDDAMALSLGLTSYVSGSRVPERSHCRREEPRDGLDRLISAWERGDASALEGVLGPEAKEVFESSLEVRSWTDIRSELWPLKSGTPIAVGYKLGLGGRWSEPEEIIGEESDYTKLPPSLEVDTAFKSGLGANCGTYRIKFFHAAAGRLQIPEPYLIDNKDLWALLRLISSCAVEN